MRDQYNTKNDKLDLTQGPSIKQDLVTKQLIKLPKATRAVWLGW